jgi:hypothetical protein
VRLQFLGGVPGLVERGAEGMEVHVGFGFHFARSFGFLLPAFFLAASSASFFFSRSASARTSLGSRNLFSQRMRRRP